mgnify:FL=1
MRENEPNMKSKISRNNSCESTPECKPYHWWIVLPVVVVSMTTTSADPTLLNDLMIRRAREKFGIYNATSPSSETACNSEHLQNDTDFVTKSTEVQKFVSHLNILMAGVGVVPAVLTYIILGANCDRIGRRPLLIIPCVGRVIRFIILLLLVRYNLSDVWLIVSTCIDGLFGSNSLLLLGAIAYISDCTTKRERSRAMLLEEAAVALTRIFPLLGLGFWLRGHDYTLPISIDLGINCAAIVYIFCFQPESCGENNRHILALFQQLKQVRLTPIRGTYRVFLIQRPEHNQRTIILLTSIQIVLFIILFGFVSIHPLYLYGKPFCFDALNLAILTSAQFALMIFITIVLSIFEKASFIHSMIISLVGIFMYMIHLVLFGVAHSVWLLYLGKIQKRYSQQINVFFSLAVFIGCLFFVVMAVVRSQLTKLVDQTEYALVFIATGIVETIGSYILGIISNAIYARTIDIYPGIIFFILAGIGFIPLIISG